MTRNTRPAQDNLLNRPATRLTPAVDAVVTPSNQSMSDAGGLSFDELSESIQRAQGCNEHDPVAEAGIAFCSITQACRER